MNPGNPDDEDQKVDITVEREVDLVGGFNAAGPTS